MKVYRSIFLLMSGLWYLIWYRLVIVWMLNMYKKIFRSRVIFVYNKMLWKKDLNFVNIKLKLFLNKNKNQKKFYYYDNNILLKEEVLVKSKTKKELSKLNFQKQIKKLNKEIDLTYILNNFIYFENFYGHIIIFTYWASINKNEPKKLMLGIIFFNYSNIFNNCYIFRLCTDNDYNTVIFILKFFFISDNNINIHFWKNYFYEYYDEIIKENSFELYIDENIEPQFYKFKNLNDLIEYLEESEFK